MDATEDFRLKIYCKFIKIYFRIQDATDYKLFRFIYQVASVTSCRRGLLTSKLTNTVDPITPSNGLTNTSVTPKHLCFMANTFGVPFWRYLMSQHACHTRHFSTNIIDSISVLITPSTFIDLQAMEF